MVITANPLLASFQIFENSTPDERMVAFDWNGAGVSVPYIIFITGRCGSTLLARLLKSSGLCGSPDEFFNDTTYFNRAIKATTFSEYFRGLVREHSSQGRFGFEIDPMRFAYLKKSLEFFDVFPREITPLFWMTRRDFVAQAWSFAKAKVSGVWHMDQFGLVPGAGEKGVVLDRDVWREIGLILTNEQAMERFFAEHNLVPCRIDYETLAADKNAVVTKVMQRLGCAATDIIDFLARNEEGTQRQTYSDRDSFIARFSTKFRGELGEIENARNTIDVGKLRKRLEARHGVLP